MGLTATDGTPLLGSPDRTVGDTEGKWKRGWLREIFSLLKWSMLAATTVGPGTVVVCAKVSMSIARLHLLSLKNLDHEVH